MDSLSKKSGLFLQLGLVLALFIVHVILQHKSNPRTITALVSDPIETAQEPNTVVFRLETPKPKTPKVTDVVHEPIAPKNITTDFKQVANETKEPTPPVTITSNDDPPANVPLALLPEDPIDDVLEPETVIFEILENAPVFPGCKEKLSKAKMKKCFADKVQKHIQRKFDTELASSLGLAPGNTRIHCVFKINANGEVVDINARASHPKLADEAKRVMQSLPKMTPGMQQLRPVVVPYTVPITLKVE